MNKTDPALLLSLLTLIAECVHINCSVKDWHFEVEKPSLEIQTPEEFVQTIEKEPVVYTVL